MDVTFSRLLSFATWILDGILPIHSPALCAFRFAKVSFCFVLTLFPELLCFHGLWLSKLSFGQAAQRILLCSSCSGGGHWSPLCRTPASPSVSYDNCGILSSQLPRGLASSSPAKTLLRQTYRLPAPLAHHGRDPDKHPCFLLQSFFCLIFRLLS